jgi:hypothetical protein
MAVALGSQIEGLNLALRLWASNQRVRLSTNFAMVTLEAAPGSLTAAAHDIDEGPKFQIWFRRHGVASRQALRRSILSHSGLVGSRPCERKRNARCARLSYWDKF